MTVSRYAVYITIIVKYNNNNNNNKINNNNIIYCYYYIIIIIVQERGACLAATVKRQRRDCVPRPVRRERAALPGRSLLTYTRRRDSFDLSNCQVSVGLPRPRALRRWEYCRRGGAPVGRESAAAVCMPYRVGGLRASGL